MEHHPFKPHDETYNDNPPLDHGTVKPRLLWGNNQVGFHGLGESHQCPEPSWWCCGFMCWAMGHAEDLSNQIRYSTAYRQKLKEDGAQCGTYLHCETAEWFQGCKGVQKRNMNPVAIVLMAGLPRGWSDSEPGAVRPADFHRLFPNAAAKADSSRRRVVSFSNCQGCRFFSIHHILPGRQDPRC